MIRRTYYTGVAEIGYLANISERDVNRLVEEEILPTELFDKQEGRRFTLSACILANFYFKEKDNLSKKMRLKVMNTLIKNNPQLLNRENVETFLFKVTTNDGWMVQLDNLCLDMGKYINPIKERCKNYQEMNDAITFDEDVMNGEPVFKGTRILVRTIASLSKSGMSNKQIRKNYPAINMDEMISYAKLWAEINPLKGRPKKFTDLNPDWKLISKSKVDLIDA
jgi:uncharacterized protein (DUF433 family)